ncbi:hypothetical protein ABZ341_39360 [Streptomyces sp. NPDC006173]|uniref:hypothetical protein n=1 Tax=Streptomyces sp. NPDC006173 TaxID=3155349 RepID=UPI0033F3E3DD
MDELRAFLLPIWVAALTLYATACAVVGAEPGAPWWLRWPLPVWNAIAHDWRRTPSTPKRPDYVRIARLERELGMVEQAPERPIRHGRTVCLTKNCDGDTVEIRTWQGTLATRTHHCEAP